MRRHQLLTCGAFVLCIIALAYSAFAPTRTAAAAGPAFAPATAVPPYRFLEPRTGAKGESVSGIYLYTADPNERAVLIEKGWIEQQQEGYVFRRQVPGTVPLFRVGGGASSATIRQQAQGRAAKLPAPLSDSEKATILKYISSTPGATSGLFRTLTPVNTNATLSAAAPWLVSPSGVAAGLEFNGATRVSAVINRADFDAGDDHRVSIYFVNSAPGSTSLISASSSLRMNRVSSSFTRRAAPSRHLISSPGKISSPSTSGLTVKAL